MTMCLLALALLQEAKPPEPPKDELADELRQNWLNVLDLCREEKKDDLQKALAAMEMTRDEMRHMGIRTTIRSGPKRRSWTCTSVFILWLSIRLSGCISGSRI
jgi:hypothetical protein